MACYRYFWRLFKPATGYLRPQRYFLCYDTMS